MPVFELPLELCSQALALSALRVPALREAVVEPKAVVEPEVETKAVVGPKAVVEPEAETKAVVGPKAVVEPKAVKLAFESSLVASLQYSHCWLRSTC